MKVVQPQYRPPLADELDTTYAQSPATPSSASLTVAFDPITTGQVTVKTRNVASVSSPVITRTIDLMQGATVIATRTIIVTMIPQDHSFTTTATETGNITDRTALRVRHTDTV